MDTNKDCDVCKISGEYEPNPKPPNKAEFDVKTMQGPWAYVCKKHFKSHAMFKILGVGKGQHHPKKPDCVNFCIDEKP